MFVVLDTNHFRELRENSPVARRLAERLDSNRSDVFTCIVAAETALELLSPDE